MYEEVGSNSALILSVNTLVTEDGTLCVAFEGVIGSPTISAICVRSARKTSKCPISNLDQNSREWGVMS